MASAAATNSRGARSVRSGGSADAPKSSAYKGVSWHKHSQKWYAYIQAAGKMRGLGYFDLQEDAARAYDAEARKVGTLHIHLLYYKDATLDPALKPRCVAASSPAFPVVALSPPMALQLKGVQIIPEAIIPRF